jgi:hypothetical protein
VFGSARISSASASPRHLVLHIEVPMRSVGLSAVSLLLAGAALSAGCGSPCDLQALAAAQDGDAVLAACTLPPDLSASWTCATPLPEQPTVQALRDLHQACDLAAITSQERFAAAGGDPVQAAALYAWMQTEGVEGAGRAAALVAGDPPFEGELVLPSLAGAPAVGSLVPAMTVAAPIEGTPAYDPDTRWKLEGLEPARALAVGAEVPVASVRHALANVAPGEPLLLTVLADRVSQVPLHRPATDSEAPLITVRDGAFYRDGAAIEDLSGLEAVRLHVDDGAPTQALIDALGALSGKRVELAMGHAPCRAPSAGMTCLAGGGVATIPTVYIDIEATDGDADACRDAKQCWSPVGTWAEARERCSYRGKRLPSASEWDRAVQAGVIPADEPAQWTLSWAGEGSLPWGVCDAAPHCAETQKRALSDGKAKAPTSRVTTPLRCASSQAWLATQPSFVVEVGYPPIPSLEPQPELAKIANAVQSDDLAAKDVCGQEEREGWAEHLQNGGRSTVACRDPLSYVTSNEPRRHVWAPWFTNLGGGYFGVGSDQSYDFISAARSEWAWVFDYDPNVVRLHWLLEPLIKASETPEAFVARFDEGVMDETIALVREATEDETRANILERFFRVYRGKLRAHYGESAQPSETQGDFGWLRNPEHYAHIRTLHLQDRLVPVGVDMLATTGMRSVGAAAREMGVPIRVYYTSNAPTAWGGQITEEYRQNVLALPFDEHSVVLATFNWGGFEQVGYWHYNVMNGLLFQDRMARPSYRYNGHDVGPAWDRVPGPDPDLTLLGLPGADAFPGLAKGE